MKYLSPSETGIQRGTIKTELFQTSYGFMIAIKGRLDLEKTNFLRNVFVREFKNQCVVFNFRELSFVGSNGILHFFKTINEVAQEANIAFDVTGLGEDFKKIVKSYNYANIKFDFVSEVKVTEIPEESGLWKLESEEHGSESIEISTGDLLTEAGDSTPN